MWYSFKIFFFFFSFLTGNIRCWHGRVDVLLGNVCVDITCNKDESDEKKSQLDLEELDIDMQMLAETIVFSFLQKRKHPNYEHFLIPCIGISRSQVVFCFYDSEKDVLLRSKCMNLYVRTKSKYELIPETILALWLVLNYKHLGSGLSDTLLKAPKANFFQLACDTLDIYKNELGYHVQDIQYKCSSFLPSDIFGTAPVVFEWPSNLKTFTFSPS